MAIHKEQSSHQPGPQSSVVLGKKGKLANQVKPGVIPVKVSGISY